MRLSWAYCIAVVALCCSACSDEQQSNADEPRKSGQFAAANYRTDLTGVCPDPVVIQGGWLPAVEFGGMYQLIGSGGEVDPDSGAYRGPLGATGVELEIRMGGPYVGFQTVESLMYQNDDVLLGVTETDKVIQFSRTFRTTAVMVTMDRSPRVVMWDPEQYSFDSFEDIGASDAKLLVLETDNLPPYLIHKGLVPADKFDYSYDGTPARFVAERKIVQQGTVTFQVYQYEQDIKEWGRPVDYLFWDESGFDTQAVFSVRNDRLRESSACLEELVPLLQQAYVDYFADPSEVNDALLRIVDELASFWTLSKELNAYAADAMVKLGIAANGPGGTFGSFDLTRTERFLDEMIAVFDGLGQKAFDADARAEDIVTNRFLDESIGMRAR